MICKQPVTVIRTVHTFLINIDYKNGKNEYVSCPTKPLFLSPKKSPNAKQNSKSSKYVSLFHYY